MNQILFLTACVNPKGMAYTKLSNPEIRLQQYKDALDWYLENTAAITVNDLGANESLSNLARYVGGNKTSGQLASWGSQAVPEPTSGLLMLVGLAGLALRRKRA